MAVTRNITISEAWSKSRFARILQSIATFIIAFNLDIIILNDYRFPLWLEISMTCLALPIAGLNMILITIHNVKCIIADPRTTETRIIESENLNRNEYKNGN
jgi:uncharacterized membrane protein YhdT